MPLTDDGYRCLMAPFFYGDEEMAAKKGSKCATDSLGMMPKTVKNMKPAGKAAPKSPVRPADKRSGGRGY